MSNALIQKMQSQLKNKHSQNEFQNESQNEENGVLSDQNGENNHSENDSENEVKTDEPNFVLNGKPFHNFSEVNPEEKEEEVEVKTTQKDPLDGFIQEPELEPEPEPTTIGETVKNATGDSAKNLKNLATIGEMALDMADVWKAQLCSAVSGQHPAEYTGDQKAKQLLIEAIKEYFSSKEMSTPSPFWTLMIALGMWGLPAFGAAYWHRIQFSRTKVKESEVEITYVRDMPNPKPTQQAEQKSDEEKKDYSYLKEVKSNRRRFIRHATTGTYSTLPNGTYCAIAVSDEKPSEEILFLINAGKSDIEIREIIGNE